MRPAAQQLVRFGEETGFNEYKAGARKEIL